MTKQVWYSRTNGAQLNHHKGFGHEALRGDLTTEKPREAEKKVQVFMGGHGISKTDKASKPTLSVED